MAKNAFVDLPPNTWVEVRAMANAGYTQHVKIKWPGNDKETVLDGRGEYNTPLTGGSGGGRTFDSNGICRFTTPPGGVYTVEVSVTYDAPGGGIKPSPVWQGGALLELYETKIVLSEDAADNDWNDAVVQFTWWRPPRSMRSQ